MFKLTNRLVSVFCAALAVASLQAVCLPRSFAAQATTQTTTSPLAQPDFEHFYGIYVGGQKVGWMHAQLARTEKNQHARLQVDMQAKVMGMGQTANIELHETRDYSGPTMALDTLTFTQAAATGQMRVSAKRQKGTYLLNVQAGGAENRSSLTITETLADTAALYRLGRQGQVGQKLEITHFDASIQKNCLVRYIVDKAQIRNLHGVDTHVFQITASYPELGVEEISMVDEHGQLLETRVGGFFVARLEPAEVAKQLDYSQDLLISGVIPAPSPLTDATHLKSLELVMRGFPQDRFLTTPRQSMQPEGQKIRIHLQQDPPAPRQAFPANNDPNTLPADVRDALVPTPFIQSDHPILIQAAQKAVGNAKTIMQASTRLQDFVFNYLQSEYVPAYSNALEAYQTRRGDCTEHSVLFVALARAVKIPARVAVGVAYWPQGRGFGWHAWAEIYTAGRWITVDPTWHQPIADATHLKLAEGDPASQARVVMLMGQLQIESMKTP